MLPTRWQRWISPRARSARRLHPAGRSALNVEALEDRTVPSFAGPVAFGLPAAPRAVATGHFEGAKAPLDVVTADANGTVSVLPGKGDGTLQSPINIPLGGSLTSVAVGDFLGNGLQDIVAANANGTVSVLLSNGNGTFRAAKAIGIGATPDGVAVGDLNGDGKLDIVTANANGTVTALFGNGDGTFGAPVSTTFSGRFNALAVGEFNGDGKPDLAVGTNSGVDVLLGNGDGTFQAPVALNTGGNTVTAFAVGDFTGDGKPDVVTSNAAPPFSGGPSVSVLAGNGDDTFQAALTTNFGEDGALAAGDFRGDGKLDLALAANNVTVLLNTGADTFATTPAYATPVVLPSAAAAGDFNGDGKKDLVVTGIGGNAAVLLNNGDGTFRAGPALTVGGTPDAVVVGDFNGDHRPDIAVGTRAGKIDVFLGHGNGTFGAPVVFNLGTNNSIDSLAAADFNHDGMLDLAVTSDLLTGDAGRVTILLGKGNGTFVRGQVTNVGVDALALALADLNGDRKPDLVTTTALPDGSRDAIVLLGNGNGTFLKPAAATTGGRPNSVGVGDFTGDGKPDLVLVDRSDNVVSVLPGNGNGTFRGAIPFRFNGPVTGLGGPAVGDFFETGNLSVAVTTGVGIVSVLQGNGDGTFQAPVDFVVGFHGTQPSTAIAADLNGDGKLDLAATNALTGDVSVLLNAAPPAVTTPAATTTSLTADVGPAVSGQPVNLTATVMSAAGTPTGTVTFFDGNTLLDAVALDPNGQAVLTVKLGAGTHSLRAVFAGTGGFTASQAAQSETVNKAGTTTALVADPRLLPDGRLFLLLGATVTPVAPGAGTPTGTVTFFDGTTVLGTGTVDANGQAGIFLVNPPKGTHTLTAVYSGDDGFLTSTSDPLVITI